MIDLCRERIWQCEGFFMPALQHDSQMLILMRKDCMTKTSLHRMRF